jgi:hypothetical protein
MHAIMYSIITSTKFPFCFFFIESCHEQEGTLLHICEGLPFPLFCIYL